MFIEDVIRCITLSKEYGIAAQHNIPIFN